jgi:putative phosphoribosyl transferase
MIFRDRVDAGQRLARRCLPWRDASPLVLGLPRGGVPVAREIAKALGAPLDVLVVRKLGAPFQPELGLGAIAPDGVRVVNAPLAASLGVSEEAIAAVEARESAELQRRLARYRRGRPPIDVAGRTVLLVDDGIATGYTARAAIRWLRTRPGIGRVVLAVPVIAGPTARDLESQVDDLVAIETPEDLYAIGAWYEDFAQVSDEEVIAILAEGTGATRAEGTRTDVAVRLPGATLAGDLVLPAGARGVVLFAHGSGSSRHSPRNRRVAHALEEQGLATLLLDLLTREEERADEATGHLRFDIRLLADRLLHAIDHLEADPRTAPLPIGLFGASTGGGAALVAAAERPGSVRAVVSRGGRPDLAGPRALEHVQAPTLLIVGGRDETVLELNRAAASRLRCPHRVAVVPGATHLFEEAGALDEVARLAAAWFVEHLARDGRA